MIIRVTLLCILVVAAWFYLVLREHAAEEVLCVFTFVVDLNLTDHCITLVECCWGNYFLCTILELIRKILSGGHVTLLKLLHFHTVSDHEIVWDSVLVELNIIFKVFVLLLVQQILLSSLRNVVGKDRVSLMELGLVLSDTSIIRFLRKKAR